MACVVADCTDSRHNLNSVAGGVIVGARLNRSRIVQGVARTSEKGGNLASRVSNIGLNRARDIRQIIRGERAIRIIQRAQVHTSAINAKVNWQLISGLVPRRSLGVDSDGGCHAWVDH